MNRLAAFGTTIGTRNDKKLARQWAFQLGPVVLHKRQSKFVLFSQLQTPAPITLATDDAIEPGAPDTPR